MNVHLLTDGRVFESPPSASWVPPGARSIGIAYGPGDVAWFEEDILLVVKIEGNRADAIPHPMAKEMMHAALYFVPDQAGRVGQPGPERARAGLDEAMAIHQRWALERGNLEGAVEMLAGEVRALRAECQRLARHHDDICRDLESERADLRCEVTEWELRTDALRAEQQADRRAREAAEHQTAGLLDDLGEAHALLDEAKIEEGSIAERVSFLLSSRESARDAEDKATRQLVERVAGGN